MLLLERLQFLAEDLLVFADFPLDFLLYPSDGRRISYFMRG